MQRWNAELSDARSRGLPGVHPSVLRLANAVWQRSRAGANGSAVEVSDSLGHLLGRGCHEVEIRPVYS